MGKRLEIKAGDKFGKWTVLEETEPVVNSKGYPVRRFKCRCECGTVRNVLGSSLNTEHSTSCGCYRAEWAVEHHTTHGGTHTWLYREWKGAKRRAKAGGRWQKRHPTYIGVDIDPEWESSFEAFRDWALSRPDYAEGKELDRIDNTKGYYPWNCRWTDRKQQVRNTSRTRRYDGEPLIDVYERECDCGITYRAFYDRVVIKGWDVQTALHKVMRKSRRGVK